MFKIKSIVLFGIGVIALHSCSYDNVEEYYEEKECDTTNISFSLVIDPIIERNCKACHYTGNPSDVVLITYNHIKAVADNGKLLGSIKHLEGFEPMPEGSKLSDCSIQKIETWINNGTPND